MSPVGTNGHGVEFLRLCKEIAGSFGFYMGFLDGNKNMKYQHCLAATIVNGS